MGKKLNIACADLGGTHCRSAVVAYDGNEAHLLEETYVRFRSEEEEDIQRVLREGIGQSITVFRGKIDGIGIDVAAPVQEHARIKKAGNVRCLHNRPNIDLARETRNIFSVPAVISNDLEAPLAGEVEKGSLRGVAWAMLENIGTGWGGARLYNGVPVAGEPGHLYLPNNGAPCTCGRNDCAEAKVSGHVIEQEVIRRCTALDIQIPEGKHPCVFADEEAAKGTAWAAEYYLALAGIIGNMWGSNLNNCHLFTHIVYQGSFLESAMNIQSFRDEVRRSMLARSMFQDEHENVKIMEVQAPHLPNGEALGPLYGAASIWKQLQRV
ncbi:MAG: ROK family protein [Patescibacteria group bacterium]